MAPGCHWRLVRQCLLAFDGHWQTSCQWHPCVASDGTQAIGGHSFAPTISADGRFVAFHSDATNLLGTGTGADTNGQTDVFVHDLSTGETVRVSINSLEEEATGGPSSFAAISGDGRFIGFESDADDLAILLFNWTG